MGYCKLPLALLTGASLALQLSAAELDDSQIPGIYIERNIDSSSAMIPALQGLYFACAETRLAYKRAYEQGGVAWAILSEDVPKGYNVPLDPMPEPDWQKEKVGVDREEEYFWGDKYAKYTYKTSFDFSEVDRCVMVRHESLSIELDTGIERFLVSLDEKLAPSALPGSGKMPLSMQYKHHDVERLTSPVLLRRENDAKLAEIGKDERIARLLSLLYADTETNRLPGVNVSFDPKAADKFKELVGYTEDNVSAGALPRANDEHYVLGHGCDIIGAENFHGRLWYWAAMHHYPTIMERPILLKSEVTSSNGKRLSVAEALSFKLLPRIDDDVFELEAGLRDNRERANSVPR